MLAEHFLEHDDIHWLDATIKYGKNSDEVIQMFKEFFKSNSDSVDCLTITIESQQPVAVDECDGWKPTTNVKFSSIKFSLGTLENIDSAIRVISVFKKGQSPIYKPEKELQKYHARHHNPILDEVNCKFTQEEYIKVRFQKNRAMIKMKSDPIVERKPDVKKVKPEPKISEKKIEKKTKSDPKPEKKVKTEKKIKSEVEEKPKSKSKQSSLKFKSKKVSENEKSPEKGQIGDSDKKSKSTKKEMQNLFDSESDDEVPDTKVTKKLNTAKEEVDDEGFMVKKSKHSKKKNYSRAKMSSESDDSDTMNRRLSDKENDSDSDLTQTENLKNMDLSDDTDEESQGKKLKADFKTVTKKTKTIETKQEVDDEGFMITKRQTVMKETEVNIPIKRPIKKEAPLKKPKKSAPKGQQSITSFFAKK